MEVKQVIFKYKLKCEYIGIESVPKELEVYNTTVRIFKANVSDMLQ
jgi:hypothetical protein